MKLRVTDDDTGTVTVSLDGKPLREFWYTTADHRQTMERAQYYREGYADAIFGKGGDAAQGRKAEDALEKVRRLEAENVRLRQFIADLNNKARHEWVQAVDEATGTLFGRMSATVLRDMARETS